jgi:RimJ/RimL family protein N-acetyltransferase
MGFYLHTHERGRCAHYQIVYTWNERAIRVYERAGFRRVRVFTLNNKHGESEWLEMAMEA